MSQDKTDNDSDISRRIFLAGTGAAIGASALSACSATGQPGAGSVVAAQGSMGTDTNSGAVVFTDTTVVTNDAQRRTLKNVSVAVDNGVIAAIGDRAEILSRFSTAEIYDGRRKALLPGLINCHAHLTASIARGFNEDFGFPNSLSLPESPASLLSSEEATLMSVVAAIEGLRSGSTTMVQNTGGIARDAAALAETGQRWVFAESVRDIETVDGPMSPPRLANSVPPTYSDQARIEGMQRIADLHSQWHGANNGLVSVFPAAALAELSSLQLLKDVREFAEQHELGYTIHMTQSQAEVDYMLKYYGVRPAIFLDNNDFLGPRLFAAHARYCDATEIAALGRNKTIITHQAAMAANRGVNPPITALRQAGCTIALGTDNNDNDMLHVMKTAISMERIQRQDEIPGTLPQPEDMLRDAAHGGAQAVNQASSIGSLEVGKKADLIVLDMMKPHLIPSGRVLSVWIHNGQPSDIETVMVDGKFIMRDHRILTVDEEAIMEEAYRVNERVWGRILRDGPLDLPRL